MKLNLLAVFSFFLCFFIAESSFAQSQTTTKKTKTGSDYDHSSSKKNSKPDNTTNDVLITIEGNPHPDDPTYTQKNSIINSAFSHIPINDGGPQYQSAKEEWVKNYPEEYKAWLNATAEPGQHKISAREFKTMPKDRQENIRNNPEKYSIVEDE